MTAEKTPARLNLVTTRAAFAVANLRTQLEKVWVGSAVSEDKQVQHTLAELVAVVAELEAVKGELGSLVGKLKTARAR